MKPIPVSADMGFKISQGKRNLCLRFFQAAITTKMETNIVIRELIINRIEYNGVPVSVVSSKINVRQVLNIMF